MALIVPTQPTPAQTLTVNLSNQACQIILSQLSSGLFMDLYVNDNLIIGGVICNNEDRIVRNLYLGFSGDFIFVDEQGEEDPNYLGLGSRFQLVYLTAAEAQDR